MRHVVIDSNVLVRDYFLASPSARLLAEGVRRGLLRICVAQVVLDEVATKHAEETAQVTRKLTGVHRDVRRLWPTTSLHEPVDPIEPGSYRTALEARLTELGAIILPYPSVSHERVANRALSRNKPFDGEGRAGYRDALIWHSVLELVHQGENTRVALISQNTRDFFKDGELHPDLAAEVPPHGDVRAFPDLDAFCTVLQEDMTSQERLALQLASNSHERFDLKAFIEREVKFWGSEGGGMGQVLGLPHDVGGSYVSSVLVQKAEIPFVARTDAGIVIEYLGQGEVEGSVSVDWEDWERFAEVRDAFPLDADGPFSNASAFDIKAQFRLRGRATLDPDTFEVMDNEIDESEFS